MKFGLRSTRLLLAALGHPHHAYPSLHVAGTNGKGSTAAMLASVCMESGYRTGLYTSPHLVRFTERIRVDGREIPEQAVAESTHTLIPLIERLHATFFEVVTAIAFRYFADERVDVAVVETGLGGRLDSTNVITPLVSVITTIGLDHSEYLGTSLTSIAREKAGIMKAGVPCVTGADQRQVLAVFRRSAARLGVRCHRAGELVQVEPAGGGKRGLRISGATMGEAVVVPGLHGEYQLANVRLAAAVCELLMRRRRGSPLGRISRASVMRGLRRTVRNSGIRGRFETVRTRGRVILDVAHNPSAVRVLVSSIRKRGERNLPVVFGVMQDKDYRGMLQELGGVASVVVPVQPATSRALPLARLRAAAVAAGLRTAAGGTVRQGVRAGLELTGRSGTLLVTGSHYVVGEALTVLEPP
jgi:dihydrofolate synthase/folylpolyglutamate synthase